MGRITRTTNGGAVAQQTETTQPTVMSNRPELLTMLHRYTEQPVAMLVTKEEDAPPTPNVNLSDLSILTAAVIDGPLKERRGQPLVGVKVTSACGRFVIVEYDPVASSDPQILLALFSNSEAFHKAMRKYQDERGRRHYSAESWYRNMMTVIREDVLRPLALLQPTYPEARFAIRWLTAQATFYKQL